MRPIKLIVKTNSDKYSIIIGRNLISNLSRILKKNSINFKKCFLVLDKNVPNKYIKQISNSLKRYELHKFIYNANEKNKNQKNVTKILNFFFEVFDLIEFLFALKVNCSGSLIFSKFEKSSNFLIIDS